MDEETGQLLAYNPSTGRCDNPQNVIGCSLAETSARGFNPRPPPPLSTTTRRPVTITITKTTTTTRKPITTTKRITAAPPSVITTSRPGISKPFSCSGLPNGNHANPVSCSSFYMCSNGIPHLVVSI